MANLRSRLISNVPDVPRSRDSRNPGKTAMRPGFDSGINLLYELAGSVCWKGAARAGG